MPGNAARWVSSWRLVDEAFADFTVEVRRGLGFGEKGKDSLSRRSERQCEVVQGPDVRLITDVIVSGPARAVACVRVPGQT